MAETDMYHFFFAQKACKKSRIKIPDLVIWCSPYKLKFQDC